MSKPYEEKKFAMALDPIHIGTGGYRLGRVDNTIARDPATNLPIVFGSSIEGTARTYSAYSLINDNESIKEKKEEYLNCAGKSNEEKGTKQCGNCEICITYGFSTREKSLHGMAQFSDAQILFFPVHTMIGPVWATCPSLIENFETKNSMKQLKKELSSKNGNGIREKVWLCDDLNERIAEGKINLGWIYLEAIENSNVQPEKWKYNEKENGKKLKELPKIDEVLQRLAVVSDSLFAQIVNSNLEVRTSVSIDPETGAAEEKALFTYEAIPRGTILSFTVTFLNPANFPDISEKIDDKNMDVDMTTKTVRKGLELFETLGVGGMSTRGFGRFKILNANNGE